MNPAHWRNAARQAFFHGSTLGKALCLALQADATHRGQAVLLGANYAGGLTLDDNPSLSALALAQQPGSLEQRELRGTAWQYRPATTVQAAGTKKSNLETTIDLCVLKGRRTGLSGKQ